MFVNQISVFIENRKGRLAALTRAIADAGIDLYALSIADTTSFGILRCITADPKKTVDTIKKAGFTANITEVIAVVVEDKPGGIADVLQILLDADVNVEYLYSFVRNVSDKALILLRVDNIEKALAVFDEKGVKTLSHEEACAL